MKLTDAKSKVIGVHLGEATLSLLPSLGMPPIRAKIALVGTESNLLGHFEMTQWSERAVEALRTFMGVLEEEALRVVFDTGGEQPPEGAQQGETTSPPQF